MRPLLSVVMPTFNGERFVAAALDSVRRQYREGLELIVVDDGSTDGTLEIVRKFSTDIAIRLLAPGRLGNWVAATNLGLREASGEWACFLHQDDLWLPGRLDRLWGEMETARAAFIFHNAQYVGPEGQWLGRWTCPLPEGSIAPEDLAERLLVQNFIAIPAPVFRRSAAVQSGGMNEALWFSADWDLWLRLAALGHSRFIGETLCAFRIHPASQTASRKLSPDEWDHQLTTVLADHLRTWPVAGRRRVAVERAAKASIAVNSALAAASRHERVSAWRVVLRLFALGPLGWHRYLRDSRIVQRVTSRLRVQRLAAGVAQNPS